jgi:hypothetical protein
VERGGRETESANCKLYLKDISSNTYIFEKQHNVPERTQALASFRWKLKYIFPLL